MTKPALHGDLQLEEDHAFQRRGWIAQRIAWAFMLLILITAVLGVFGSGVLSDASIADEYECLSIDYQRFGRRQADQTMTVRAACRKADQNELSLWLDRDYISQIEIESITPEPKESQISTDRLTYLFPISDQSGPKTVTIRFKPKRAGCMKAKVGMDRGPDLEFTQYVYP